MEYTKKHQTRGSKKKSKIGYARSTIKKRSGSKVTKATDIPKNVRQEVLMRDRGRCIFCGTMDNLQCHHYLYRKPHLGMGIKENLVMLCINCHDRLHKHDKGFVLRNFVKDYLDKHYPGFKDKDRVYRKYKEDDDGIQII